ncbi:MAG: sigma-70 family RNA polymerase sigma factor [Deltaproteobacteria bacterium]|nr:sigma-70 family RNA polymerase sigma factor [Deltaproteobacteria bacterium]
MDKPPPHPPSPSAEAPPAKKAWEENEDDILIQAHVRGDSRAFEVLFKRHSPATARLIFSIVKDDALTQDVAQEVFLQVFRHLDGFQGRSSFRTWLYRIAVNEALRQLNRSRRWTHMEEEDMEYLPSTLIQVERGPSPEKVVLEGEEGRLVRKGLEQLSPPHRIILTLFYLEELSAKEISEILDIPEGSVKSRLHYARLNLKKNLEPFTLSHPQRSRKEQTP